MWCFNAASFVGVATSGFTGATVSRQKNISAGVNLFSKMFRFTTLKTS
jgi:hypothetical protein